MRLAWKLLLSLNVFCGLLYASPIGNAITQDDTALMEANSDSGGGGGWLASATNALAAPAGQIAMHFAKEMISRSASNSQVSCGDALAGISAITNLHALIARTTTCCPSTKSNKSQNRHRCKFTICTIQLTISLLYNKRDL